MSQRSPSRPSNGVAAGHSVDNSRSRPVSQNRVLVLRRHSSLFFAHRDGRFYVLGTVPGRFAHRVSRAFVEISRFQRFSLSVREISGFKSYIGFPGIGFGLWPRVGSSVITTPVFVNAAIVRTRKRGPPTQTMRSWNRVLGGLSTLVNEVLHADAFIGSNAATANNPPHRSYG